jgi:general secretion pathway protein L
MTLLRIRGLLRNAPVQCEWALLDDGRAPVRGQGRLAELPRHAGRVQLVIPATEVLLARTQVPRAARRHAGSVLAFAVEEVTLGEPDAQQVSWLGAVADADVLAVTDRQRLQRWLDALDDAGIGGCEVQCEILMLPWTAGEWSLAWDGREGYLRTGELEGAATDCGARRSPPLSLRLAIDAATARGARPASVAIYTTAPDAAPEVEAWQHELKVPLRMAGPWDWRAAATTAGVSLLQSRRRWRALPGLLAQLRPAAWIAGCALAIHALAAGADWALLASEQRTLRLQMEARFRAVFPDAVAVVDPALQMRRKLAEARHATGQTDSGDFLPLSEQVAVALKDLPAGSLRVASYENGRLTLQFPAIDAAVLRRVVARLVQAGLSVDTTAAAGRAGDQPVVISVSVS